MLTYAERFNDIAITHLNTEGFTDLTLSQKKLACHLAQAGLWGRFISLDQGSEHNVPLFRALLDLKNLLTPSTANAIVHKQVSDSLFMLFAHNGIYHSTTGEKLPLPLDEHELNTLSTQPSLSPLVDTIKNVWFSHAIKTWRTVQTDGVDSVAESGSNFYKNLTTPEVLEWRAHHHPQYSLSEDAEVPPYGFNERLHKDEQGKIYREVVCAHGLYGPYVQKIIENLMLALEYSENQAQHASISSLIRWYQTGDATDFDAHCVAWVNDTNSHIYFINGLIESYDDPLGVGCGFESIVAFKNPLQTAKVNKIIENIQWFENSMPFAECFKKEKAQGLSASSISVVSMAGETSPSLPLGINLPNSDWIRKKHGSKSVNLENSASSRSLFETPLREAMFLPQYHGVMEKYLSTTNSLHTDLHEIAGHGSGKLMPGVSGSELGVYYSVIEECRADLVALYFIADEQLKHFGIFDNNVDVHDAGLAQYIGYLTNGAFGQLRRINPGHQLTQAHFRNRQLIAQWILANTERQYVEMVHRNGYAFIQVHHVEKVREKFGELLSLIQTIKSTGDTAGARDLVMAYGTQVDQHLLTQVHQRVANLNMPKTVCFTTPVLDDQGDDVVLTYTSDFMAQQVHLFEAYCNLTIEP